MERDAGQRNFSSIARPTMLVVGLATRLEKVNLTTLAHSKEIV